MTVVQRWRRRGHGPDGGRRTPTGPPVRGGGAELGGPDSLEAVRPFLRELAADRYVFQGWARCSRSSPLLRQGARPQDARAVPPDRRAIPIAEESAAQAAAVAAELARRGLRAHGYVAMACWHPFSEETVRDIHAHGIARAVALPLYPHYFAHDDAGLVRQAGARGGPGGRDIEIARIPRYPDAPGFIERCRSRVARRSPSCRSRIRTARP